MENLRDNELFDELGKRLRNYSEEPDEDVWNKISGATQNIPEPKWIFRMLYTSVAASIVAFLLLIYPLSISNERFEMESTTNHKAIEKKPNEENISSIANGSSSTLLENKEYSLKANKTTPSNILIPNHIEEGKSFKSEEEIQYIVENKTPDEMRKEIRGVTEGNAGASFDSDSIKKPQNARTDSAKVKDTKPAEEKNKKVRRGFDFYALVTPILSYQKVTPLQNDNVTVDKFLSDPVISGNRFGISFEAGVQGRISKHFEYYGGLSYYQQNQTLSYHYKSEDGTTVESGSDPLRFTVSPGEHDGQVNYSMKNIGAQLGILYYLKGEALTHKVGAGLSYQHGLQKVSEGDTYDNSKSSYLFYQLFYRTEFRVNESIHIFFQPTFGQAILSNEKLNEPFKLKPYRAGLSVGIMYHF